MPIPNSATQAADIESMSSDLQAAERVDTVPSVSKEQKRTDRLTITDLAIVCDGSSEVQSQKKNNDHPFNDKYRYNTQERNQELSKPPAIS